MESRNPTEADMAEVCALNAHIVALEREIEFTRLQLKQAWTRVPFDATIVRQPYKSDIAVTCRECGHQTKWRTGKGIAQCQPLCQEPRKVRASKVNDDLWNILNGAPAVEENLDDD